MNNDTKTAASKKKMQARMLKIMELMRGFNLDKNEKFCIVLAEQDGPQLNRMVLSNAHPRDLPALVEMPTEEASVEAVLAFDPDTLERLPEEQEHALKEQVRTDAEKRGFATRDPKQIVADILEAKIKAGRFDPSDGN